MGNAIKELVQDLRSDDARKVEAGINPTALVLMLLQRSSRWVLAECHGDALGKVVNSWESRDAQEADRYAARIAAVFGKTEMTGTVIDSYRNERPSIVRVWV